VQWKRTSEDRKFVPMFTHPMYVPVELPAPEKLVRVFMRVLMAAGGDQIYIVNPLSGAAFELNAIQQPLLRCYIADDHQDSEWLSPSAPWIFQLPDDALYPVASQTGGVV
jgi:hypothetical protein